MAIIISHKRSDLVDNASAKASTGWNSCMGKPMCKWPAILGILLGILVLLTCTYFLLRCLSCCCCDCLSGGRYRRGGRKHKYADLHAAPYGTGAVTTYQSPLAPPGYPTGQQPPPPQYAQFERQRGEDSLPAMPSWNDAQEKKVYDGGYDGLRKDVEMGALPDREKEYEQRQPMLATAEKKRSLDPGSGGYVEMDGGQAGDLGQAAGYRPYGQAYTAYAPGGGHGNSWKNV
ncbi:MAG: hypothetical protein LQ349_003312 [Xanthoria aureola]|nr:MAG: hypothetical protein LQ349_003312 [Xanthoria aureola]